VEGAAQFPYAVPHVQVEFVLATTPVPVGSWRGVYNTQNAFAAEAFLDEVAHALGRDPYALRRSLLRGSPRHLAVLDLVAREAGWNTPPPAGRHRGIAIHECFGTIAALVVEVALSRDMAIRVPRAVCAVDCGIAVNPDTVEAQIEGAVVFGLSAVLTGEITIERGRARQTSFGECDPIRMPDAPRVEVHIVPSREPPGGIGEPGVPLVAPAVAGALFAATGRRIRRLPIRRPDLRAG
jgi:isoquinoline 1-oxidoreductase subunit beta